MELLWFSISYICLIEAKHVADIEIDKTDTTNQRRVDIWHLLVYRNIVQVNGLFLYVIMNHLVNLDRDNVICATSVEGVQKLETK